MAAELEVIKSPSELTEQVLSIRDSEESRVLLSELGGGVLRFTEAVFPGVDIDKVLVQKNTRESEGRGPHFDVYQNYINKEFPWIAIFNLSGLATLTTLDLPEDLATSYQVRYPEPTDIAFEARRLFSVIALETPGAIPSTGNVKAGTGIVISQGAKGPHVIHDVVPTEARNPGKFLKFVVPSRSQEAKKRMKDGGYETLDEVITKGISEDSETEGRVSAFRSISPGAPEARDIERLPRVIPDHGRNSGKRRCNLD